MTSERRRFLLLVLAAAVHSAAQNPPVNASSAVIADFEKRVTDYVKQRNSWNKGTAKMKTTDAPEAIKAYQIAVAANIVKNRAGARQGDFFTPEITQEFHKLIARTMKGASGPQIRSSLQARQPVKVKLEVNQTYAPFVLQATPPTLILNLVNSRRNWITGLQTVTWFYATRMLISSWTLFAMRFLKSRSTQILAATLVLPVLACLLLVRMDGDAGSLAQSAPVAVPEKSPLRLPMMEKSTRFAAIGDNGTGLKPQYDVGRQMYKYYQMFKYDSVVMLGDNIYGNDTASDMRKKFEDPYQSLLDAGVKFFASLGNHDSATQRFYKHFNMGGNRYYSFKLGDVEFFALDTNFMNAEQINWITRQLSGSRSPWKIVFFHAPLYSSARFHGSDKDLRNRLEPIFVREGVDVVLSGHDHVYERIKPQQGIYYWVIGNSGQLRPGDLRRSAFTEVGVDRACSFVLFEIGQHELYFQTISQTGETLDSGVLPKRAAPTSSDATGKQ